MAGSGRLAEKRAESREGCVPELESSETGFPLLLPPTLLLRTHPGPCRAGKKLPAITWREEPGPGPWGSTHTPLPEYGRSG